MRVARGLWMALAVCALSACGPATRPVDRPAPTPHVEPVVTPPAEPVPEPVPEHGPIVPEDTSAPDGPACTRSADCDGGLACRGAPGCRSDWACGEARTCGAERVAYCDCEGVSFYAAAGCPGRPYAHVGPCADASVPETSLGLPDGDEPITSEDRTCETSSDCSRGQVCFGIAGCGDGWRCERVRGCSRTRVAFCGCDGQTFTASSDCPGRAFVRRGPCDEAIASAGQREPRTSALVAGPESAAGVPAAGGCTSSTECRAGRVCTGPPGCGMTWTCERPAERCNPDTQVFCDCEGETFRASMTCPGRPFAHRGSCELDRMLDLSGAALR